MAPVKAIAESHLGRRRVDYVLESEAPLHIDHDSLVLKSEGDVEAKLLIPLITNELYLGVPSRNFFAKEYLGPTDLDKGAKVSGGYYPDFSVWIHGFPVVLVEAKTPGILVEQAYREAALYARHLNSKYPAGFNPANFIIASSGDRVLFGKWDAQPEFDIKQSKLRPGSKELEDVQKVYGFTALRDHALGCQRKLKPARGAPSVQRCRWAGAHQCQEAIKLVRGGAVAGPSALFHIDRCQRYSRDF
ncbi:type I restriction enzyme HsdR N-terminal domain-containing protein [Mesorhizobium sp. M0933]|uniref:type I restriction enzyme HsdR N-terminal domain-containing protein n=1 Tax=Mesorhizobium sp. M0933 TaxID=2957030 RepID=UPI00333D228F